MRSKENGELGNCFFRATVRCSLGLCSGKFGLRQRKIVMSRNVADLFSKDSGKLE